MTAAIASPKSVGLFIDAENASHAGFSECLKICQTIGNVSMMRCYGSSAALEKWKVELAAYPVRPMLTPLIAGKANSSDFALVIDAVAIVHQHAIETIVIYSDDSDFSQLAMHIRDIGLKVHGVGTSKTKAIYRDQFDSFRILAATKVKTTVKKANSVTSVVSKSELDYEIKSKIKNVLIKELEVSQSGSLPINFVGQVLAKEFGNNTYRKGYGSLQKFLSKVDGLKVSDKSVELQSKNLRK